MTSIPESYTYCVRVAKERARNFYYSFLLLPKEQRRAMCAIYAFMRHCDDLSDEPGAGGVEQKRIALARWRIELQSALDGQVTGHPVWPAFLDTVSRFQIPHQYFFDMVEGVSSDLEERTIETFDELYQYCYRVASVVGMTIIHIFGFETQEALALAEKCGIAFQLTNILRDVREDAENGRVYLPQEDLERFGVEANELRQSEPSERVRKLLEFEAGRAKEYYRESLPLVGLVHRSSRASLWALIEIYSRLLGRIEQANFDVFRERIRLSGWEKVGILVKARLSPGTLR